MSTQRRKPGAIRPFGDQVEEACKERNLLKQELAAKAEISPSQLAHYLKFGGSLSMMRRISSALGVHPEYFDVYVAADAPNFVEEHPELIEFMRRLRTASVSKRREMLKRLP